MEPEVPLNTNSSSVEQLMKLPEYLKNTPEELSLILIGFEEFKEKRKLIPFFSQYEFATQKEKMLEFWNRIIERVLQKYEKTSIISVEYLQQLFNFNGFQPMGLSKVIDQLAEENHYLLSSDKLKLLRFLELDTTSEQQRILDESIQTNANQSTSNSFTNRLLQKINFLSFFKKDSFDGISSAAPTSVASLKNQDAAKFIVSKSIVQKSFQKFKQFLSTYPWQNEHFSLEAEFIEKAQQENIHICEIRLFLELLEKDGSIKSYQETVMGNKMVFYDKEKYAKVNPDHFKNMTVLFDINQSIKGIVVNIEKNMLVQTKLKEELATCLETQVVRKKQITREYMIHQQNIEQLLNKKNTLLQNYLQVEAAIQNKRVFAVLNQGINAAKQNQIDVALIEDIKDSINDANEHEKEIADTFAQMNTLSKEEQEQIDRDLMNIEAELNPQAFNNNINNNKVPLKQQQQQPQSIPQQYLPNLNIVPQPIKMKNEPHQQQMEVEEDSYLQALEQLI